MRLTLLLILLLFSSLAFCAAKAEVLYMEPAPPAPSAPQKKTPEWKINQIGEASVGYQTVKDSRDESKDSVIGKVVYSVNGQREQEKMSGAIQFDRKFMTTGDIKNIILKGEWKGENNEFSLSHNLSDTGNIVARIYNLAQLRDTKLNFMRRDGEYSFVVNLSQTTNENRSAGTLQQRTEAKERNLSIIKKGEKSETRLVWSNVENNLPITGAHSSVKNLSLKTTRNLKGDVQLLLGLESTDSDSRGGRTQPLVSSSNKKYSAGLTIPMGEKWKLKFSYDSLKNSYSSAGMSVSTSTNILDYTISYQLLPPLAWETSYNIYKTSGQSETRRIYSRLSLTGAPHGYFRLGATNLLYQLLSVKDRTGRTVSENDQVQLNVPFNLGTKTNVMGTFTLGKQESAGPGGMTTNMKNYNITWNYRASSSSRYYLQYNTNETSTRGLPSNSLDNYRGGVEWTAKAKGKDMPLSLTRTSSSSSYGTQGADVDETALTIGFPSPSPRTRIKYTFALTSAETRQVGKTLNRDAKKHSLNLSLANKKGDTRLESFLSYIDTDEDLFNISFALVHQKGKDYKVSLTLFKNRECFYPATPYDTSNIFLEILYGF
jgi:hypothetical protein